MIRNTLIFFLFLPRLLFSDLCFIDPTGVTPLQPVQQSGISTPDYFLMPPAVYAFNGPSYDCSLEGLYVYYVINTANAYRIVYSQNIDTLLHSITWLHSHGYREDNVNYATAKYVCKSGDKIHMTCGSIVNFTCNVLNELSIPNRFILWLTLDPWNSYNNGHSVVEVKKGNSWKVWDMDMRCTFSQNSVDLNAWQLKQAIANNDFQVNKFSTSPIFAYGDLAYGGYNYQLFLETTFLYPATMKTAYRRSCQVLLIRQGEYFYFTCNPSDRARVESYSPSFVYMTQQAFLETFYP